MPREYDSEDVHLRDLEDEIEHLEGALSKIDEEHETELEELHETIEDRNKLLCRIRWLLTGDYDNTVRDELNRCLLKIDALLPQSKRPSSELTWKVQSKR